MQNIDLYLESEASYQKSDCVNSMRIYL